MLAEIFVYMEQYKLAQYFRAVAVFASRSCDPVCRTSISCLKEAKWPNQFHC
ncbi:MAG: DUF2887 domain-containing protein [Hormoscilla sp. GM7CHS1pb]|nr:DUF2887 domain-containing protein [Hormoscilla sp. GM7CHS1pb]